MMVICAFRVFVEFFNEMVTFENRPKEEWEQAVRISRGRAYGGEGHSVSKNQSGEYAWHVKRSKRQCGSRE